MLDYFIKKIRKTKNIIFLIFSSLIIFVSLRFFSLYEILISSLKLDVISFERKINILHEYIFIYFLDGIFFEKFFVILFSILISLNLLFMYFLYKKQRSLFKDKNIFSFIFGMFLGLFGVGCLSCGALLLAPILIFLGLGSYVDYFAEYGLYVSIFGFVSLCFSLWYIIKKINQNLVCK